MSRIGNKPVSIIDGVTVNVANGLIDIEGPKGKLSYAHRPEVSLEVVDGNVKVSRGKDDKHSRAFHGLTRALVQNMIVGVKEGYEKKLELQGVGYVCQIAGKQLKLRVGLANELVKDIPEGLVVTCPDQTHVDVKGCDKQKVGQFAAEVRSLRKPEPYKGKGIRYVGEHVKIKPGKSAQ
ncbi:MAG: large subunit ribosomal protein L6 [Mariniblastus sp.]|jgi:large subunit ribosomal protein L6